MHEGYAVHIGGNNTFKLNFRNDKSAKATDIQEIESNAFAAALLMPESMVRNEFNELFADGMDPFSDDEIQMLAEKFDVSQQALMIRLSRLGLLNRVY